MRLEHLPGGGVKAFAPAKVNLFLEILGVRPDGYHEIDTLMQEVSLFDEIEIARAPSSGPPIRLEVVGEGGARLPELETESNLVHRAARLFLERTGGIGGALAIRLLKRVPMGAGLGGGSSDGACTLLALNVLAGLKVDREGLRAMAALLGSDVAFFVFGGSARCRGRGERVEPLGSIGHREGLWFVLGNPGFHIPTSLIYRELDRPDQGRVALTTRCLPDTMSAARFSQAIRGGGFFFNRLELVACRVFPQLEIYKKEFEKEPFEAVLMSGSGSTIYGVTRSPNEAEEIAGRLRKRIGGTLFVASSEPEMPDLHGLPPA